MARRISLSDRRADDVKGIDAIFGDSPSQRPPTQKDQQSEQPLVTALRKALENPEEAPAEPEQALTSQSSSTSQPLQSPNTSGSQRKSEKGSGTSTKTDTVSDEAVSDEKTVSKKPDLAKVTIYIRPDQVFAVEAIQLAERQKTGSKPDKSDLMQEALDLLVAKYR